jgi:multiple antibiotic resistance protein
VFVSKVRTDPLFSPLLLFSDAILKIIGRQGAAILVRVMGIILCSLAVETVLTTLGVASWAPVPR